MTEGLALTSCLPPPLTPLQCASLVETDLLYADALWDQEPSDTQELSFKANDVIEVLDMSDDDWWYGCVGFRSGWFPASFVRVSLWRKSASTADIV